MSKAHMFTDAKDALQFIMSGNATFTVVSKKSEKRFTYKVLRPKETRKYADSGFRFVRMMTGSDNETSYSYIGTMNSFGFKYGNKSPVAEHDLGVVALRWVINWLKEGEIKSEQLEIWHEGRCGACGRKLTVPASIESGIGPECAKRRYICE